VAVDVGIFSLHRAGVSSLLGAINFLATVRVLRRTSVILLNMRLFVLTIIVTVFLLILSLPVLASAITMLLTDRQGNRTFFDPTFGGNVLIFQHLF
jgi:heme/copper-type cytochrome/quinol oxidase subunit 1